MTEGYSIQNWVKIEQAAHALKGSSGRVGAGKIHYACYHICDAYHKGDFKSMLVYYPLIIEAVIEFRRYSRELIAGVKQQDYEESESVSNVPLVDGYKLIYQTRHDKFYCLKLTESIDERLKVIDKHQIKPEPSS